MDGKQSYYDHCKRFDIIGFSEQLLKAGYRLRDPDGKFCIDASLSWNGPWHHVKHVGDLDCRTWHHVMFDYIFQKSMVPSQCQNCWKVVVRPKTLAQLFALLDLQKRLDRPSKCGIETREFVHGLYGGYFYNTGKEAGLECWHEVRAAVDDDPKLGPEIPVILKRACTEFEMACGPSDKWEITPRQLEIEALVNTYFIRDITPRVQPEHLIINLHARWVQWAYAHGDSTYQEFTNGKPLYPPYVTYHPQTIDDGD